MDTFEFEPREFWVITEAIVISEKTEAGIIKSESQIKAEKAALPNNVVVKAVGPDVKGIKPGDKMMPDLGAIPRQLEVKGVNFWAFRAQNFIGKFL